jgi:hypothetical protein
MRASARRQRMAMWNFGAIWTSWGRRLGAARDDGRASVSGKFTGKEMGREPRRGKWRRGVVAFLGSSRTSPRPQGD